MGSTEAQKQTQDPNSLAYTAIDPNANKPKTFSTPDQSDKIRELTKLPGFTPAPPFTAEDLILYKKVDLDYGKLSKEHFDRDLRYLHDKKHDKVKIKDLDPGVKERMKELIITDKNGNVTGIHNTQDHHVIHQSLPGVQKLFKELGLDIHAKENRITLPADKELAERNITSMNQHVGRHDKSSVERIEKGIKDIEKSLGNGMSKEQAKQKLLDFIQEEKQGLEAGNNPLNSVWKNK